MKGGGALAGLRGKQVSLTLIALICTTFLIWGWERVPFPNVFPVDDQTRRVVLPKSPQKNSLERFSSGGTPREETSPKTNSSIIVTDGSPSILAEKSPAMSGSLSNISIGNEDLTTARSSSNSEKDLLGRQSTLKTVQSSSFEKVEDIPSATEELATEISPPNLENDPSGGQLSPKAKETVDSRLSERATDISNASRELAAEILPPYSDEGLLGGQSTPQADKSVKSSSSEEELAVGKSSYLETKVCDYTEGKWVVDSRRPIYSGTMCKRWLSEMWACRLTQRTDFSYEKYRWQPNNCDMPLLNGQEFLKRMQSKTLAFVGDSLGRQQFQSMMCLITGGRDSPDVQDVGREYGLVRARGAIRPDGWAYRFPKTNTTVLYYWSASLCEIEPLNRSDPLTYFAMHLDRPAWFLHENLYRFDVVVLNTGHHWNRGKLNANRWHMYVNGQPNNNKHLRDIRSAQNFTVHSVVKWVDGQFNKYPKLRAFTRSLSPRHFFNGDWDTGGRCDNTKPLSGANAALQSRAHDPVAESAVRNTRVELLDITGFSQLRDEAHLSKYSRKSNSGIQDCLHWCLPGVPDTWNELLFAQLFFPQGKNISVHI